jgi:phage replication-related protein YjqB (UPF0714/DUF867 family)
LAPFSHPRIVISVFIHGESSKSSPNVNTAEPREVAAKVINALKAAGYNRDDLDFAAMAMLSGAARL